MVVADLDSCVTLFSFWSRPVGLDGKRQGRPSP